MSLPTCGKICFLKETSMFPSLFSGDRKRIRILLALLIFSVFASLASAQTDNWVGPSGNWSDASQWDNGVPVAGDNIVIGTPTANSIDDFSLAIGALDLGNSGDVLHIADGVALTLTNNEVNSGTIQLNSAGTNTYLLISGSQSFGFKRQSDSGYHWPELHAGRIRSRDGSSDKLEYHPGNRKHWQRADGVCECRQWYGDRQYFGGKSVHQREQRRIQ